MTFENWFIEQYINSPWPLPGALVQPALNLYMDLWNRVGMFLHHNPRAFPHADEIAAYSKELMDTHYDQPQELFENFLGGIMKYSTGLWANGTATLEDSQRNMLDDVCVKAGIADSQTILDIGCGFGSFIEHALRRYPHVTVYGLSLSKVQCDYMRQQQNTPGHSLCTDRFHLIEADFNDVRLERRFDRIVSIGVFEHVSNFSKALQAIHSMLLPDGQCFLHFIVFREPLNRLPPRAPENNFIHRYIFPGGRVWFDKELYGHQQDMRIERFWYLNGRHYRRTLEAWLANFLRNRNRILATGKVDERMLRIWELYLRVCISLFRSGGGRFYGNGQYLLRPA